MKAIVVAVDLTPEAANPAIEALRNVRISPETTLVVAHVLPSLTSEADIPADIPRSSSDRREQTLEAEKYLESLSGYIADAAGKDWEGALEIEVASGEPADEIVRLAGIYEADLIVLGSRGLAGINRVILGSVSTQVVGSSRCSVYVVKQ